jgi:site-specific DNA-methyltransferase (adenine-specific)
MEYMSTLEDNAFDLAIVDPPYGIDAANRTMGRGSRNDLKKNKRKNWDKSTPNKEYFDELKRISENQIIWGGNYFLDYLGKTSCMIIWDKKDYNSDFADGEIAWTSFPSVLKIFVRARSTDGDSKGKIHPTQKPIALYTWLIEHYAKPGQRIIDTHLGSGSSAIAAHYYGVDFVGCELDKDYFDAATERINSETRQATLFGDERRGEQYEQTALF